MNRLTIIAAVALALSGCDSADTYAGEETGESFAASGYEDEAEEREPFDEDAAREQAEEEVVSEGYDGPCTYDCSGHEAGFAWAADGNPDYGVSRSPSFDEGQEAYEEAVEDRVEEYRQAYEDSEDY